MTTIKTIKIDINTDIELVRVIVSKLREAGLSPEQARKLLFQAMVMIGEEGGWDEVGAKLELD